MGDEEFFSTTIDANFLKRLRQPVAHSQSSRHRGRYMHLFNNAMLEFSDQQIVTGIAMLTSGFVQIPKGLSTHHWTNITNLAWLASVSHLTTLTMQRKRLRNNRSKMLLRLAGMISMSIMLACGMGSLGYYWKPEHPAWCLFHPKPWVTERMGPPYYNSVYVGLTLSILFVSYITRIAFLFPEIIDSSKGVKEKCEGALTKHLESQKDRIQKTTLSRPIRMSWNIYYKICYSFYVLFVVIKDLYCSMLWEVHLSPSHLVDYADS